MTTERNEFALPVLKRYPVIAGALCGLAFRLIFSGHGGSFWSPMMGVFIFGAPILIGLVTVYLAERQKRRSYAYYVVAPILANLLFVGGTLALVIEGWICALVIVPMFVVLGMLSGLVMGFLCREMNWPNQTLQCAAALLVVAAFLGPVLPTPDEIGVVERSIAIDAPAAAVWQSINDIREIEPSRMSGAHAMRIGVPPPISGVTRRTEAGLIRETRWGKQVHFDEVILDWQPERFVRWSYRFSPDSFPRGALDDHVMIGGHYFDLIDTSFSLQPSSDDRTTLVTTRVRYRISTQFNFYADWVAQIVVGDLNETGLRLYKERSEAARRFPADDGAS